MGAILIHRKAMGMSFVQDSKVSWQSLAKIVLRVLISPTFPEDWNLQATWR